MASKYKITLKRGASYTTPFGRKVKGNAPLLLTANDPHLEWFKGSSRFNVAAVDNLPPRIPARQRAEQRRKTARNAIAPAQAQPAEPKATPKVQPSPDLTPQVQPPAPKAPAVDLSSLTRAKLMSAAKEHGLEVKATDTKAALRGRIEAHLHRDGDLSNNASDSA